jgi:carboxyl-terminal processing protease
MNDNRPNRRRERVLWSSITAVLVIVVLVLASTPSAFAQARSDTDQAMEILESVFRFIQESYVEDVDTDTLLEGALRGLFESLDDPYSAYLDEADMRNLTDTTEGEFGGVGMFIAKERPEENAEDSGFVEIIAPIDDTPAFRAGLRAGDLIVGLRDVDGEEFLPTDEMSIDEAVDRLRGTPGTRVVIQVRRGERAEFTVTLERAVIQVPTARHAMIDEEIAFLRIIRFTPQTVQAVQEAIDFFEQNDYQELIIDLRTNPGGLLSAVIDVTDLFFDDGTIVGTSSRVPQENDRFTATDGVSVDPEIPVVVLINQGSASAAEIMAGALQDRDRAYLIGETTFGKGSVQQIRRIADGGFRLTMSRYYLPSGRFIDEVGVDPDLSVETPELTDDETEAYAELRNSGRIESWVSDNLDPSGPRIDRFVDGLQNEGFNVPDRFIKVTIRDELNRQNNQTQVYDLEYDVVLQEAVELLREGQVPAGR